MRCADAHLTLSNASCRGGVTLSLVYVQRKGELPWRERRIVAGASGSVIRYETTHDYVKGWCQECDKWKLFWITEMDWHITPMWIIGIAEPTYEQGHPSYKGVCTNGHESWFRPFETPDGPRWKRDSRAFDCDGRDYTARTEYQEWLEGFRHPEREAHYQPGHECDSDCPMYDWEYGDW